MAALASLGDGKPRQLFELVAASAGAIGRDEVAGATGTPSSTVSFHLDRLVQDGLLAFEFHKPPGKSGPGSGQPGQNVPAGGGEEPLGYSLPAESFRKGCSLAETAETLEDFLLQSGYRPEPDGDGGFLLPICPFHGLSDGYPGVVRTMNGAFQRGAASRFDASSDRVAPADLPGHCCARIMPPA